MRGKCGVLVRAAVVALMLALALSGCASVSPREDGTMRIVATTPIIADIARQIAGPDAEVTSIVPAGADPHSYEPSLRDARNLAYADIALSNHLLLEEQRIMRAVSGTLPDDSLYIPLSEESERHGAELLPVVENQVLDQLWLGARVEGTLPSGDGKAPASPRSRRPSADDDVVLRMVRAEGPGSVFGYITETFGRVEKVFDSTAKAPGLGLPPQSHTHLSWAFTEPGEYHLTFAGGIAGDGQDGTGKGNAGQDVAPEVDVTVVVGKDPASIPALSGKRVLEAGHTDISLNLTAGRIELHSETGGRHVDRRRPEDAVIRVASKALTQVPADRQYRFLGEPGKDVYLLPQAVLGKHVHGTIDPHVWLDPRNVKAWAVQIKDALVTRDPEHAEEYRSRAAELGKRLDTMDRQITQKLSGLPTARRQLVTTHDAFAYLARAYRLTVAGFAVPATSAEPGPRERARLAGTLRDLKVPAVFDQPGDGASGETLRQVAAEAGVRVCTLRSDTLDRGSGPESITTYEALMTLNADELARCLGP